MGPSRSTYRRRFPRGLVSGLSLFRGAKEYIGLYFMVGGVGDNLASSTER